MQEERRQAKEEEKRKKQEEAERRKAAAIAATAGGRNFTVDKQGESTMDKVKITTKAKQMNSVKQYNDGSLHS